MQVANRWMYTGCLSIGSMFLARTVGAKKKEIKHECFSKALEVMKTQTVAEILAMKDPGCEAIRLVVFDWK